MSETTPTTPPRMPPSDALDRFFGWLRGLGVPRDTDDRWVAGVSSGLAYRLGVDPIVIRAAFVVAACFGGFGVTAYLLLWALLPSRSGDILAERAVRGGEGWPIVLLVVTAFSLFSGPVFAHNDGWWAAGWLLPAAVIAWVVYRLARKEPLLPTGMTRSTTPPTSGYGAPGDPSTAGTYATQTAGAGYRSTGATYANPAYAEPTGATTGVGSPPGGPAYPPAGPTYVPPPRAPRKPRRRGPGAGVSLLGLGLALVAYGAGYLLRDAVGFPGDAVTLGLIAALATMGLFLAVLGVIGRSGGFNGFVATLLVLATAGAVLAPGVRFTDGVGDRTWRPAATTGEQSFRLGAGDATLDLSGLSTDPATPARVSVSQGVGDLTVEVPEGLTAHVSSSVGVGDITLKGRKVASRPASGDRDDRVGGNGEVTTVVGDGPVDVYVDTSLGLGSVDIRQVP